MSIPIPDELLIAKPVEPAKYLYLLIRTDMASMGRGKGTAQGAHAANQFTDDWIITPLLNQQTPRADVMRWRAEAKGFGTTISLAVPTLRAMQLAVQYSKSMDLLASLVADPEYPLSDGAAFHLIPNVVTTAYVFANKDFVKPILGHFDLLPNDVVPVA
jgi:peptidyl-tRNA hydrolase